jgi:UDP-N-acetylglucosamine 2-epimerase (non-hydrolysing)
LAASGLPPGLIFTGQHPQLDPAEYGLEKYAAVRLYCAGQEDPHGHVGEVTKAVAAIVANDAPELVVVQGDTSSALGGALGARVAGIPVAHVEAGLRSHDRHHPWPEEEFRVAIDRDSELLFAPTELSAANLRRERVPGRIHVTGNSGIDAVLGVRDPIRARHSDGIPRILVTCHRRENWGQGVAEIATALRQIAAEGIARVEVVLHPNPAVAGQVRTLLLGEPRIAFTHACGHSEMLAAMLRSNLVLSDSGGIQEEATALGIPVLVLRRRTERPEAIATGNLELVGTEPRRVVSAVRRQLARATDPAASLPFGDGRAGERIAAIIVEWLGEKGGAVATNDGSPPHCLVSPPNS